MARAPVDEELKYIAKPLWGDDYLITEMESGGCFWSLTALTGTERILKPSRRSELPTKGHPDETTQQHLDPPGETRVFPPETVTKHHSL